MMRLLAAVSLFLSTTAGAGSGEDWVSLNNPGASFDVNDFTSQGDWVFVSMGPGMARSNDAGLKWEVIDDFDGLPGITDIVGVGKGGTVVAANDSARFFRSEDFGESWQQITSPALGEVMNTLLADGGVLYATTFPQGGGIADQRLWRSNDRGNSWEQVSTPDPGSLLYARGAVLLLGAVRDAGFTGLLLRSADGGKTWTEVFPESGFLPGNVVEVDDRLFATLGGVQRISTDNGVTWSPLDNPPPGATFVGGDNGTLFAFGGDPFCSRSTDLGATWTPHDDGIVLTPVGVHAVHHHDGHLFLGGESTEVQVSKTTQPTWEKRINGMAVASITTMAADSDDVFAVTGGSADIWRLRHGDAEFDVFTLADGDPDAQSAQVLELWSDGDGIVYAGTQAIGIYRSTDNGETWTARNQGVPQYNGTAGLQFREIESFTRSGSSIFAGTGFGIEIIEGIPQFSGGGAIRSTDGGQSWHTVNNGLPINQFNSFGDPLFDPIHVIRAFDGVLLAGHFTRGVFRSTNNGTSWTEANSGMPAGFKTIFAFAQHDGAIFLGGAIEGSLPVWMSTDGGATWTSASSGLAVNGTCNDLVVHDGTLYAGLGFENASFAGVYEWIEQDSAWQRVGSALNGRSVRQLAARDDAVFAGTIDRSMWQLEPALPCPADVDGSGEVDVFDLTSLLAAWGSCQNCAEDVDDNGVVDVFDLIELLGAWGPCTR